MRKGADVMDKLYGETEKLLNSLFQKVSVKFSLRFKFTVYVFGDNNKFYILVTYVNA